MKIAPNAYRLAWGVSALLIGALVLPFSAASGALLAVPVPHAAGAPKAVAAALTTPTVKVPVLPAPPLVKPPTAPAPSVVRAPTPPLVKAPAPQPTVKAPVVPSPPPAVKVPPAPRTPPPVKAPVPPVPPVVKVTPPPVPVPKITPPVTGRTPTGKAPSTSEHARVLAGALPPAGPLPAGSPASGIPATATPASTRARHEGSARARAAGFPSQLPGGTAAPASQPSVPGASPAEGPAAASVPTSASLPAAVQAAQRTPSGGGRLPGISIPAAAGSLLLLIVLALTGVLGFGLLSAEGLVPWELRRRWRSSPSWIHHHPWNWHG